MTANELRNKFLDFFKEKGHAIIPSASLVPLNDPTVLFTTAGMHPLVPFLLGQKHPAGNRLADVQKCVRTGDIDEVGDDFHLTFFEMLGNWSLGDYFKKDAIAWSFEFLTDKKWLGIPLERLAFTCFAGDKDAPRDEESASIWMSHGVSKERIAFLPKEDNWWGPAGLTGPCGPDTEMFYWVGDDPAPAVFDPKDKCWVEIWNDVFMQYNKTADGAYEPLKQQNVDTGMGLERTLAVLKGKKSVYETELFANILKALPNDMDTRVRRIIADHARTIAFIITDGVAPSNKDRGYVLRKLIRRVMAYSYLYLTRRTGEPASFNYENTLKVVCEQYELDFEMIQNIIREESIKFGKVLGQGTDALKKIRNRFISGPDPQDIAPGAISDNVISGKGLGVELFSIYQSQGLHPDIARDILRQWGLVLDESVIREYTVALEQEKIAHKELSRTASAGQFKGGLADHSDIIVRYHTATHLMQAALRKVLGEHVIQKGSNITAERTRFDFSHPQKMTDEEKKKVEELVNGWITRDLDMKKEMVPLQKARDLGAIGAFGEKYGETVSIYSVSDPKTGEIVSREFCGGPHVEHTGVIGKFKILKEEAVSAGVRRIKAVLE